MIDISASSFVMSENWHARNSLSRLGDTSPCVLLHWELARQYADSAISFSTKQGFCHEYEFHIIRHVKVDWGLN